MIKIAKLYKLYTLEGDESYIGYTFDNLETRIIKHYQAYEEYKNNKRKFHESFELFEKYQDNIFIELIKEFNNIKDKEKLKIKRNEYIRKLKNKNNNNKKNNNNSDKLNRKEYASLWIQNNKQRLHDYYQEYYKNNIEKIRARSAQTAVCEVCDIELNRWSMNRHNKSQAHLNNLNGIRPYSRYNKVLCECNCYIVDVPCYIERHKNTLKHK